MEGIFRIIDRASGPMQRMERQAKQTDRAIARLGMTTDNVGTQKQQRQIGDTERAMHNFGTESERTSRKLRSTENDMQKVERRTRSFKTALIETGAAIRSMGAVIGLLKFPALGVGIGVVVQAIGALAGGIVGLMPRLVDLSGTLAALPVVLTGVVGAMVTIKLATADLSKAYSGNQQALKRLTPEARAFLSHLKQYAPVMKELRQAAQGGLFKGLDFALARVQRAVPAVTSLLKSFSRTLGGLAANAAARFTTPGFIQDLLGIGGAGNRALNRGGRAIIDVLDALRHLTAAAIPFTDWLTKMIEQAARWIDHWAIFERDSGRFAQFLGRTRTSLTQFAHILRDVWGWFSALGRAARPLGNMLWRDVERAVKSWSQYANSTRGQIRLTRQFTAMYPAIHEMVTIVTDLARTIFRMGSSPQLPGIARTLHSMIPTLERLFNLLVATFGPVLADLLKQVADILTFLTAATGPLNIMLTLIDRILAAVNGLTRTVPGLGRVFATAFSVIAIGLFISKLTGVAQGWWAVATGAKAAAVAEEQAMVFARGLQIAGVGSGIAAGAAVGGGGLAAGGLAAGESVTAGGVILPAGVSAVGAAGAGAATGLGSRIGSRLFGGTVGGRIAAGASRFAIPVTAALAAYGGLTASRDRSWRNQIGQTYAGAWNTSTGGLSGMVGSRIRSGGFLGNALRSGADAFIPGAGAFLGHDWRSQAQRDTATVGRGMDRINDRRQALGGDAPNYRQLGAQVEMYRAAIREFGGEHGRVFKQAQADLRQQLLVLRSVYKQQTDIRNQQSRAQGYRLVRQEGQAFDIYAGKYGAGGAATRTNEDVLGRLKGMQGPGRRILAQNYLAWLYEEQKGNKALVGPYRDMEQSIKKLYGGIRDHVRIVNGQIYDGTASSWNSISKSMSNAAEQARERVTKAFTEIQNKAFQVLQAMGFTPGRARALVAATERGGAVAATANEIVTRTAAGQKGPVMGEGKVFGVGGKSRALGGRIAGPGHGNTDSLALGGNLVGSGELVVNRHTERKVNYLLAGRSTLGGLVAGEGSPHSFATGGRASGLQAGIASAGQSVLSHVPGLSVTSTTGGTHAKNSYHYLGEAEDIGGSPAAMMAGVNYIMRSGLYKILAEGIHNPGLSIKNGQPVSPGFWGASTWAGHANHIHLAVIGGGGSFGPGGLGGGITAGQLAPAPSMIGGVPGVLADQAGGLMAAGMASKLNSIPWYGNGGSFRARRPMVIGVGDRDEHVSITPTHKVSGSGRPIHLAVHIGTIQNHREGDVVEIVHSEFEKLAAQLEGEFGDGVIA